MASTKRGRGKGVTKFWAILQILQMIADGFWGEGVFSDFMDVHTYEQQISFFHHISSSLTIAWLLLNCFFQTCSSIMETLCTLTFFIKVSQFEVCSLTYENCEYCVHQKRKKLYLSMLILKFSWRNYEATFPGGIEFQSRTSKGVCMCVGEGGVSDQNQMVVHREGELFCGRHKNV